MAEPTRAARPSILPKRSWGAEFKVPSGEFMFMPDNAPSVQFSDRKALHASVGGDTDWGGRDGFDNLRRQPEANVLRHHFEFAHVVETLGGQKLYGFFHQAFGSGGASGQGDRLDVGQPLRFDILVAIDKMRIGAEISCNFNQTIGI